MYKSGFAKTQEAYDKVVVQVFKSLDRLEDILAGKEFLVGDKLTEADVRLWVTIVCYFHKSPLCYSKLAFSDSLRPRIRWPFQVQLQDHPQRVPRHQHVSPSSPLPVYEHISNMGDRWMKKLYWNNPAFKHSTNFEHIKTHYYWSHPQINPTRIVPNGPIPVIEEL